MAAYAAGTKVPVGNSKAEIEKILSRYGASGFGYMTQSGHAIVMFEAHGRRIKFELPSPEHSLRNQGIGGGRALTDAALAQEERRLWRSLAMAIKSKLDIVNSGISTFEAEMLPYTMLSNGSTFSQWAEAQSDRLDSGVLPPMLPSGAR